MFSAQRDGGAVSELAPSAAALRTSSSDVFPTSSRSSASTRHGRCGRAMTARSATSARWNTGRRSSHASFSATRASSPTELLGFAAERPALDVQVLTPRRRERLTVHRELLAPLGVSELVTHVWHSPLGVFGFHFARTAPVRRSRLARRAHGAVARDRPALSDLASVAV
jgi:hypothetical protein